MTCQEARGRAMLVLPSNVQVPLAVPLAALKLRLVPLTVMVLKCGWAGGPLLITLRVPLTARLLVFQARPAPGVAGLRLPKAPPKVPAAKSLKLSPAARLPVMLRFKVPP